MSFESEMFALRQPWPVKIRLLRGQCVIRETKESGSFLHLIAPNPRDVKTHRGTVLAMGEPSQVNGHDVPWGFEVGAVVQYHWEYMEKAFTRPWVDGEDASWLRQDCIDGVIE